MTTWTTPDEELEATLIEDTMKFLIAHDSKHLNQAGLYVDKDITAKFAKWAKNLPDPAKLLKSPAEAALHLAQKAEGVAQKAAGVAQKVADIARDPGELKHLAKDAAKGAGEAAFHMLPGVGMAHAFSEGLDKSRRAQFAATLLKLRSAPSEYHPYNHLAVLFGKALTEQSNKDHNVAFFNMIMGHQFAIASAMGGLGGDQVAGVGGELAAKGAVLAAMEVSPWLVDQTFLSKGNVKGTAFGPATWCVYLAAKPRNPHKATSEVENCRLAIRAILGFPYDSPRSNAGGYVGALSPVAATASTSDYPVVTPQDVIKLLSDGKKFTMDSAADKEKNFSKIASFWEVGEVNENYQTFGNSLDTKKNGRKRFHINYLDTILHMMDLEEYMKEDKAMKLE